MAHETSDNTFENDVVKSALPVLVDFWAPWCGPCKAMNPAMEELAKEYEGKMNIVKMNVDENMEAPGKHNVMSIPTFVIYKDGKVVSQFVGARSKGEMQKEMDAVLAA
jgi:thioredoxin 1